MTAFHPKKYSPLYLECGCWIIKENDNGNLWDAMENRTNPQAVKHHIQTCLTRQQEGKNRG